jgi:C1A family cysteine protease
MKAPPQYPEGELFVPEHNAPASVDWVAKKGTASVKNQGMCGSCWAFAAMGHLNAAV